MGSRAQKSATMKRCANMSELALALAVDVEVILMLVTLLILFLLLLLLMELLLLCCINNDSSQSNSVKCVTTPALIASSQNNAMYRHQHNSPAFITLLSRLICDPASVLMKPLAYSSSLFLVVFDVVVVVSVQIECHL